MINIPVKNKRHRYIGFFVESEKSLDKYFIDNEIKNQCRKLYQKDCKELGLRLIRFDGKKGILKCNHIEKQNTIELLYTIKNINIQPVGTSGTIKALQKKHMGKKIP